MMKSGILVVCLVFLFSTVFGQTCPRCRNSYCNGNGYCRDGCIDGYYGAYCDWQCPVKCLTCISDVICTECNDGYVNTMYNKVCTYSCYYPNCKRCSSYYECSECNDGFSGLQCDQCVTGKYGTDCHLSCSSGCLDNVCSKYDGRCTSGCKPNFQDYNCQTCAVGLHGSNCEFSCPARCYTCNSSTDCNSCKSGYYGMMCENNCKGRWGTECSHLCPANCRNNECFQSNGVCTFGCKEGFKGDKCDCPIHCECDDAGTCTRCLSGFVNVYTTCMCTTDICVDEFCSSCTSNTFHAQGGACCPCSSNCKEGVCLSAVNCSYGCTSGNFGYDCAMKCTDVDQWCNECPINYGQTNRGCLQCKPGYYPFKDAYYSYKRCRQCPNTCLDSECDAANGECIKGCVHKKWGLTCQEDCPINCVKCDRNSGKCSVCQGGKYFADCSQSCSDSCNKTEGQLLCAIENGACPNGCLSMNIYGTFCENICSNKCKDNVCSWLTGECVKGCRENHWGKQCEHVCNDNCKPIGGANNCNESTGHCLAGCIDGHFSGQCDKTCSINCLNTSCDMRGKCIHGCSGDFGDDLCLKVKYRSGENSNGYAEKIGGSVGGTLAITVIVITAAIILCKRRRGTKQNIEGHSGNNVVVYSDIDNRLQHNNSETAAEGTSAAYEIIARRDDISEYSVLSCDTNQSAAFLDVGSRTEQAATEKIQTIYEKPIIAEDMREYAALEYDTSQTLDEYLHDNKDKKQNQSLTLGKGTARRDSPDNKTNTGACSSHKKTIGVRGEEHRDYINTSKTLGVSHAKKYP